MGWRPELRWDKANKVWYCRHLGKRHYLGKDQSEACRKFAKIIGTKATIGTAPETVAEAVEQWLALYGERWHRDILNSWLLYAGLSPLCDLSPDHLTAFKRHLAEADQAASTVKHKPNVPKRVLEWCEARTPRRDAGHAQNTEAGSARSRREYRRAQRIA